MSVVAVKRLEDGSIFLAADSIVTYGYTIHNEDINNTCKLKQVNNLTIGGSGSKFVIDMLFIYAENHTPKPTEVGVLEYLVEFRDWLRGKGYEENFDFHSIICVEDRVFRTENGFAAFPVENFAAIGAGEDFALAALHLEHGVKEAVETACDLSVWCAYPVNVFEHKF